MNTKKMGRILVVLGILVCASLSYGKNIFTWRSVLWPSVGFGSKSYMQKEGIPFLDRMQAAGYNALTIDGASMNVAHVNPTTAATASWYTAEAKKRGIQIIPMGQYQLGNRYMPQDLREALPNKETPFVVKNGVAFAKGDPSVSLKNPGFEQPLSGTWTTKKYYTIDNTVKHSGSASIRCDNPTEQLIFLAQTINVKPYRTYELSAWVKSQNVKIQGARHANRNPMNGCMFTVRAGGQYILCNRDWAGVKPNADWKQIKMRFSSLQHSSVKVWLHATYYYTFTGKAWFDDVAIREVGLLKTVERSGMPVVVKSATGSVYTAGKDYGVGKERLTIPAGSAIKNGEELKVSWFTAGDMFSAKPEAAFCHNEVYQGMRQEIQKEDEIYNNPPIRLMKYDEWRMAGWDPVCMQRYNIGAIGSGKYMGSVANITADLYREANGSRIAAAWNDPFDPYHNGKPVYKLTNGGCLGGGHFLSEDIVIYNWAGPTEAMRKKSMAFFAGKDETSYGTFGVKRTKQRQVISTTPGGWKQWLSALDALEAEGKTPDGTVIGINYHTYAAFPFSYKRIEELAQYCQAAGRWGTGPIPVPAPTPGIPWDSLPDVGIEADKGAVSGRAITAAQATLKGTGSLRSLTFSVPANNNVRISVVNLKGQRVSTILNEEMATGSYERKIDLSKMAPGVYFATLEVAGDGPQQIAKKMLVF